MSGGEARFLPLFYPPTEQALAIDRALGDRRGEGADLTHLGTAYRQLGDTHRAITYYEQALAIDHALGDQRGEGADLTNLGIAYANPCTLR